MRTLLAQHSGVTRIAKRVIVGADRSQSRHQYTASNRLKVTLAENPTRQWTLQYLRMRYS
jgi:hypothetical protein